MSKIPGSTQSSICSKIQPPRPRSTFFSTGSTSKDAPGSVKPSYQYDVSAQNPHDDVNKTVQINQIDESNNSKQISEGGKSKYFNYRRGFGLVLPKISINVENLGDRLVQNPRILDLRNKLNEINKKRERSVDKETKTLINDITQQLTDEDDQEVSESGPYSLLLDLQSQSSSSCSSNNELGFWKSGVSDKLCDSIVEDNSTLIQDANVERTPNIVDFESKQLREFEYSCETVHENPELFLKKPYRVSSRSDLCLNLKNQPLKPHKMDVFSPTSDISIFRPNEENSLDDSLGILTPDQMDDMFSPTVEGLPVFCDNDADSKNSPDTGDTPSTEKTETNSAVLTMFLENDDPAKNYTHANSEMAISRDLKPRIATEFSQREIAPRGNYLNTTIVSGMDASLPLDETTINLNANEHIGFVPPNLENKKGTICVLNNVEEELFPSIHSSILDPISSLVDTTVNLELPLDSKHFENIDSNATQRIDQTPSPEDLPLDPSELNGETATYSSSQVSASTLHDSQTYSEAKTDLVKSMDTSKVSNSFITSITSITSLDGYQGDGEMSRPVSRGADQSIENRDDAMDWQNIPVNRRPDPMTDSDFFTESDADGLDDHMHRGDRRAQVIDGALYGGNNNNGPLIVNRNDDSCMESSGVFTDLETHRCSPVFLNAIDDITPDGSTPSSRSECSQKKGHGDEKGDFYGSLDDTLVGSTKSRISYLAEEDPAANLENIKSVSQKNNKDDTRSNEKVPKEEKRNFALKKYKMPKRDVPSKLKSMLTARKTHADGSIESTPSNKPSKKNERREIIPKKLNTCDSKTKSFKDIKSKVDCSFSLQRSQTACSVTRMLNGKSNLNSNQKSRHMRTRLSELGSVGGVGGVGGVGSGKSSLHSSQSDISASSTPTGKHASARFISNRSTKKRESAPVATSTPRAPSSPPSHPAQPLPAHAKKNGVAALPKLPSSPVTVRARNVTPAAPPASPRKPAQRRPPAARPGSLPPHKEPVRSPATPANGVRGAAGKRAPAHAASPHAAHAQPALPAPPARTPPSAPVVPAAALAHAAKGVEALGVLVQYLVCQLEGLSSAGWREEAARWRGLAAAERTGAARASLDHQQRSQKDLDTIGECLNKISELEMEVACKEEENARLMAAHRGAEAQYTSTLEEIATLAADIKGLKNTIGGLKREVEESRQRACAADDRERALAAQLAAARRDVEGAQLERHPDLDKDKTELAAEVRSLRAVLELKQAEASELRGARGSLARERERRAAAERELAALRQAGEELRERAAARQRDADRLREESRRLREGAVRDRQAHARLALYNEELHYKLRQKSQVVSLLAVQGGAYLDRTYPLARTRAASCGSGARTPSPPPGDPGDPGDSPSPADSPSPSDAPDSPPSPPSARRHPAVKGVVEKQDSVSWVLEIEESPEEVATRLARRSGSFRNVSSPGGVSCGGVKRRGGGGSGGGSPGAPGSPGSPAPASPSPNASKLFRCAAAAGDRSASGRAELDFPTQPLKESAGEAIYIYDNRQY